MSTEPFKLDEMMLHHVIATGSPEQWAARAAAELARQLHTHGAPDLPFEEQARALLASHVAMQEAGKDLPSIDTLHYECGADPEDIAYILEQVRPPFARLTQERDEARAIAKELRAAEDAREAEVDALRQRLERAEQEAKGWEASCRKRARAIETYTARIADLEAQLAARRVEPEADVVERLVLVMRAAGAPYESHALHDMARAVISALAETGEGAWPTERDCEAAVVPMANGGASYEEVATLAVRATRALVRSRISPVLGALRARVAELEANAELAGPLCAEGVTVRAVRRCMLCGGGGNVQGMPCGNCAGTGYHE
jgi:hypothetical protein